MTDLIVFSVGSNKYALDIEHIQRIIQATDLTSIPNAHEYIDGMMSYEDGVIKVLNFRKLIGVSTHEDELSSLFGELKQDHVDWVDALKDSLENGSQFSKTLDPHMCRLGKWIDNFTAYDDRVAEVLNGLVSYHKQLHLKGADICEIKDEDADEAKRMFDVEISEIYSHTKGALDTFVNELPTVSNSLQKLLIYENNDEKFAIKVDSIEDIAHVEESDIINSDNEETNTELLELDGVLDLNDVLINVIKTINIPK